MTEKIVVWTIIILSFIGVMYSLIYQFMYAPM